MNWCSIDAGKTTGIGIFDNTGKLIKSLSIKDSGKLIEYGQKIQHMQNEYDIIFALIEDYTYFIGAKRPKASKVREQIRMCQDIFDNRIMIYNRQWQKRSMKTRYKKLLIKDYYGLDVKNDHQCDALLMAREIFNFCEYRYGDGNGYNYLYKLATTTKKWPTRKDINKRLQQAIKFN